MSMLKNITPDQRKALLWFLIGVLTILGLALAKEILYAAGALLLSMFRPTPKSPVERVTATLDEAEAMTRKISEIKEEGEVAKTEAGQKRAEEIDDFLNGDW